MTTDDLLHVVMNRRVIGDVRRTGRRAFRLRYDLTDPRPFTPLSVSMPASSKRYREGVLVPWLDGLLPDRPELLRQWRRQFAITNDDSTFMLLAHVGEDVAGAAQFVRRERLQAVLTETGGSDELEPTQIADMLRLVQAALPLPSAAARGKFSLAGAQAKVALHRTPGGWSDPSGAIPSTHIVKPAIPGMADQDLVEAITMRAAQTLGLRTAPCTVEEFADSRALVVERYDRVLQQGRWLRVHQEDMAQALTMTPGQKYESQGGPSAVAIVDLLRRVSSRPEVDVQRFAQALVFNWLVCGTDAHARNYSILLNRDTARLAPLYDVNSHLAFSSGAGNDLSMSVEGTFRAARITTDDWIRAATGLGVESDWIRDEIRRQSAELLPALDTAAATDDIAQYDSPTVRRLLENADRWIEQRARSRAPHEGGPPTGGGGVPRQRGR